MTTRAQVSSEKALFDKFNNCVLEGINKGFKDDIRLEMICEKINRKVLFTITRAKFNENSYFIETSLKINGKILTQSFAGGTGTENVSNAPTTLIGPFAATPQNYNLNYDSNSYNQQLVGTTKFGDNPNDPWNSTGDNSRSYNKTAPSNTSAPPGYFATQQQHQNWQAAQEAAQHAAQAEQQRIQNALPAVQGCEGFGPMAPHCR